MATGDSLSGDLATIWIDDADAVGSDLATATQYQAEVTNFNTEGGETDYEAIAVFGGGNIDKKKPTSQLEISMDVILRFGTGVDKWDVLKASTAPKMIAIQTSDGTNFYWKAYNNARVVNFNQEFEAENEWRGTMTFKLSPTTADAKTNIKYGKTAISSGLTTWA
jgi:hypothetical protein